MPFYLQSGREKTSIGLIVAIDNQEAKATAQYNVSRVNDFFLLIGDLKKSK